MTWFAIWDNLCQDICDMTYEKRPLLKHFKNSFVYIHTVIMNSCAYIAIVCVQNCLLRCFNSCPFHKSSHKCLSEMIPYCKSVHIGLIIKTDSHFQFALNIIIYLLIQSIFTVIHSTMYGYIKDTNSSVYAILGWLCMARPVTLPGEESRGLALPD